MCGQKRRHPTSGSFHIQNHYKIPPLETRPAARETTAQSSCHGSLSPRQAPHPNGPPIAAPCCREYRTAQKMASRKHGQNAYASAINQHRRGFAPSSFDPGFAARCPHQKSTGGRHTKPPDTMYCRHSAQLTGPGTQCCRAHPRISRKSRSIPSNYDPYPNVRGPGDNRRAPSQGFRNWTDHVQFFAATDTHGFPAYVL